MKPQKSYNWLPDFVYGGIDGTITTFAIVAGVEGASLSASIILVLGFANLFADGFSMATGKFLSDKAEKERQQTEITKIKKMIKSDPKHATKLLQESLLKYKINDSKLQKNFIKEINQNPSEELKFITANSLDLHSESLNPIKGAISTFISFILIGFIPLFAYTFQPLLNLNNTTTFYVTAIATLIALFIIGAVKSQFSPKHWILSGLEVTSLGGIAAIIAYSIGVTLKGLL